MHHLVSRKVTLNSTAKDPKSRRIDQKSVMWFSLALAYAKKNINKAGIPLCCARGFQLEFYLHGKDVRPSSSCTTWKQECCNVAMSLENEPY
jgi:hypothetical protein